MFALDLFNTDHERRLAEGAVDQLEQRRIDDLAMKMDELVARAKEPAYKKNPAALAALMKEFQKCKAERDSYYKVRNETMGYGSLGEELSGDELNQRMAQLGKDASANLSQSMNKQSDARIAALKNPPKEKSFMQQVGDKQIGMVKGAWKGLTSETGIPGNVPVEKIPGKEDLLKGKGRSYYEGQKKNSKEVAEQTNPEDDDWYDDEEDQDTELRSGDYVRDTMDGEHGEIFRMQGDPYERRVRILDRDGKGWYIEPSRLTRVDPTDPDVQRYFGKRRVRDMDEAISKKDLLGRLEKDLPKVTDPKNKNAKPVVWTGAGKDDYGYTGYQGHGMPTDKQEREQARKKKGVKEGLTDTLKFAWRELKTNVVDFVANAVGLPNDQRREVFVRAGNEFSNEVIELLANHPARDKLIPMVREIGGYMAKARTLEELKSLLDKAGLFLADVDAGKFDPPVAKTLPSYRDNQDVEEGWKSTVGGAALAGAMALGAGGAQARVAGDNVDNPDVNRLTGKPNVAQTVQGDQAKPTAPSGYSKAYLQSVVDGSHPRPMVSKEKAQELLNQLREQGVSEGWSDAMVARRTGGPRTPYSVYIKGKKWKDFENDDHARAVMDKLKAKFKADGRDPETITIAPTDIPEGVAETALNPQDIKGDYEAKRRALHDLSLNKDVDQQAVLQRRLDLDREAKSKGITEGVPQELINRYLAIDAENDVDAVRAAIQSISKDPALGANSKSRLLGQIGMIIKRHRLPIGRSYYTYMQQYMEEQYVEEGLMKEPANHKEYLDQRDKLFRMMSMESNPANKQIIKQAIKDLESRFGSTTNVREESSTDNEAVERAILNRIMVAHTDLLMKFGPEKVMQAAEEVAYNVGDVDEIGTSDVSAYVNQVKQILGVPKELDEKWSQKYKSSINCANPKGFSQKAHCAGKKK